MVSLVPFNKRNTDLFSDSFDNFQNMLDDFFADRKPFVRSLAWDTFKIDVSESEKEYVIEAEVPGIQKNEINVSLEEDRLKIAINKEENIDQNEKNYIHKERKYTSMSRNIFLADADPEGIKAKLEDGLLIVNVAKKEKPDNCVTIDIE